MQLKFVDVNDICDNPIQEISVMWDDLHNATEREKISKTESPLQKREGREREREGDWKQ
jgi:hypothetical protein